MRYQWAFAGALVLLSLGLAALAQAPDSIPGCTYNVTPPALTTGQYVGLQCDVNGKLITTGTMTAGQLAGTATNDNASAGNVGQFLSGQLLAASRITLANGTPANVTSVALTPGDWDVTGTVTFESDTTTSVVSMTTHINTVSATTCTLDAVCSGGLTYAAAGVVLGAANSFVNSPVIRVSLAGNTTYFLNVFAAFGTSFLKASGMIRARRMR